MIALGAEMVCEGAKGKRTVEGRRLVQGHRWRPRVGEDEILVEMRVPVLPAEHRRRLS